MTLILMPNDVHQMVMMSEMITMINNDTEKVKKFLGRHIIPKKLTSADIQNEMIVTSLSEEKLRFNIYGDVSV